jgi:hypothetical protein
MSKTIEQRRLAEAISPVRQRSEDVRFALLLTYVTLGWMTIEGAASLLLGWASKSLLLEAFGIDSVVELFSAAVSLWRLRVEANGAATSEHVDLVERRAVWSATRFTRWLLTSFLIPLRIIHRQAHHRHA